MNQLLLKFKQGRSIIKPLIFILLFLSLSVSNLHAQVVVTSAGSLSNICVNGNYVPLPGSIKIKEGAATNFTIGTGLTYIISPPAHCQFEPGVGSVSTNLIGDISFINISVTSSSATVFYNASTATVIDSIVISGLKVKAVSVGTGNILRTGGTAVQLNNAASPVNTQNHGTLTSTTPTVTLSAYSAICVNGNPLTLTGGLPAGGTYSGTGVAFNTFYPSAAGVGTHSITYTYTDGNGCINSASQNIVVNALPVVSLNAFSQASICRNAAAITLPSGTPGGGVYSGAGISGSNFDPSIAAIGSNTITYTVTDGNGCSASATRSITVNALPTVTLGSFADRCANSSGFVINGGSPVGGTYTAPSSPAGTISSGSFNPGTAGAGAHTIIYSYTDGNSCTNTATSSIEVHAQPGVTFSGLNTTYCLNATAATLTGFPSGGTFSGTGISGSTFNPATAGVGGPYSITYNYTDGNGCSNSTTSNTSVLAIPSVTISGLDDAYSETDDYDNITGTQSPSGGIIEVSGPGVSNLSIRFYPDVAGVGTHTIVRSYTHPTTGCVNSATKTVVVGDNTGGAINGLEAIYCLNSPTDNISGTPATGYFTGTGITNGAPGQATFNPAIANLGFHYIYYWFPKTISIFGTTFTYWAFYTSLVQVRETPIVTFTGLAASYCTADPSVALTADPIGGSFSGTGVFGSNFSPNSAGAGLRTVTYQYTTPYGCSNSVSQNTTVYTSPPTPSIVGLSSAYCEYAPDVTLSGSPAGGVFAGTGIKPGSVFSPSLAADINGAGSIPISYTYTTANGCSSVATSNTTINLRPVVSFSGFPSDAKYCIDASTVNLTGSPSGGIFTGTGITNGVPGSATFNPATAGQGSYEIIYTFSDGNNCTNLKKDTVTVNPLPTVNFSGLSTGYCHVIGDSYSLTGFPGGVGGTFTGNGISGTNFLPSLAGVGDHAITFTYVDVNGCSNLVTKNTKVYGRPKADYVKDSECAGDTIHFTDMSSVLSTPQATSTITGWEWEFSDGITYFKEDTSRTFIHGAYTLKYTVTTNRGCDTTLISSFTIGPYPKPDFTWTKVCDQDVTEFTNASSIQAGSILSYNYDFDDAPATSTNPNTTHQFTGPGVYDVVLTATSDKSCIASKTHKVFVVPLATTYPYFNDFESGAGGWVASSLYDTSATWELGFPVKSAFGSASSGTNAWATDLNGTHKKGEKSFVYSPCFNISSLTKPMVALDIIDSTIYKSAGAALQYSVNDGQTWIVVGEEEDGVEWYNESGIFGQIGIQPVNQFGWTGVTNGWVTAKHDLNTLTGSNRVRFRVAFGADQSDNLTPGFAFDDFWIGERSKLVLVEHFTNSSNLNTAAENTYINNLIAANNEDVVGISYHVRSEDGDVPDPMNVRNEEDANTRELFYSISQVPRSVVDGNFFNGNPLAVTQGIINLRALDDPEFLIDINTAVVNSNSVNVSATLTAQENISSDVALQFAVVERNVASVSGANGETTFQWVLTKLMPDGAGSILTGPWTAGDIRSQSQGWYFTSGQVYDPSQIGILVFVQNNTTKEIYQAAYKGPGGPAGSALSIDPAVDPELHAMEIYPNPSTSSSYVVFKEELKKDYYYSIVDELGKVVSSGFVENGKNGFEVDTSKLPSGMYVVRIGNDKDGFANRKLVVNH